MSIEFELPKKITKKLTKKGLERICDEVTQISGLLSDRMPSLIPELVGYRPHEVNIGQDKYLSLDAKTLNKELNQSGRGDYRYLVAPDRTYIIVAQHGLKGTGLKCAG